MNCDLVNCDVNSTLASVVPLAMFSPLSSPSFPYRAETPGLEPTLEDVWRLPVHCKHLVFEIPIIHDHVFPDEGKAEIDQKL